MPNPSLTSSQVLPGFFAKVDYNAQGAGVEPTRRCLLFGYIGAGAQYTADQPVLPASQQEVDDGCRLGSDLARAYAAAVSQPESQGCQVWVMPIAEPSAGVASTYTLRVFVSNTNPVKAGTLQIIVASRPVAAVGFTTADTATTIAAAIAAAVAATPGLPVSAAATAGGVVFTYIHKGLVGEDLPIQCTVSPNASGVQLSVGSVLFATSSVGPGSVRFGFGAKSVSATLAGGETPAQVATIVAAAFNSSSYPLYAAVDGSIPAQVNLFLTNAKDVRRVSAAVIGSTGLTANLGSSATDGTGSASSLTYNGNQGTGAPVLSNCLANLAEADPFRSWSSPFTDLASVSALAQNIEAGSDGSITGQKQQHLTIGSALAAAVAGAIAPATTPALTATAPHYAVLWSPDAPVQAMELAARVAAARASKWLDTPQFNWNGFQLKGNVSSAPLLSAASKPSKLAQNAALITYALTPVVNGPSGNLEVVKGRTTSLAANRRLWAWSIEAQAAYHAVDLALYYGELFKNGSIVIYSDPKAPGLFDDESIRVATITRMQKWERAGNFDGADALASSVKVSVNAININRFDVELPENGVVDLDQIVFTSHVTSPSS
ncbi:MAG: hypothetical protein ABI445_21935 [Polyangia bacterium]